MTHRLLPKPVAGADDTSADDATELKEELEEDRVCCVVFHFRRSVVEPSWGRLGICVACGVVFFYFGSVVGP